MVGEAFYVCGFLSAVFVSMNIPSDEIDQFWEDGRYGLLNCWWLRVQHCLWP